MFEKMVEQAQQAFKPMSDVFALNTEVMEKLAEKQASFFSDVMNDGLSYAKDLADQKDLAGFYELQKSYAEGFQSKMMSTAKDSYGLLTDAQEKTGDMLKDMFGEYMPMMMASAPATAKSTVKKAAKTTAKTVEKTAEKVSSEK